MKNFIGYFLIFFVAVGCKQNTSRHKIADDLSAKSYDPVLNKLSKTEFDRIEKNAASFFSSLLDEHGFNGSYLVAKDGEIVLEKYVGFIDPGTKTDSIKENSPFHLASVSKTFTAMAVLKLWQDGKLNIEDDLSKYFSNFPYPGVTIKMLLSHRSGLPNYVHYLEAYGWDRNKMVTNLDVLSSLYSMHPPLQFPIGKHFSYCNTNYVLLSLIVEKVTNKKFKDFLQETFFTPIGMKNTYLFELKDTATATPSFEWNNKKFGLEFLDLTYGDKNIYSTVRDMLRWDKALYAGKIFNQATLDSAFSPYSFEKDGKRNYGLGWRMTLIDNGKKLLYHNGWWHGNNTVFIRLIDEKATIIVLGNKFNRGIYKSKNIVDFFGDYQQSQNAFEDAENDTSSKNLSSGSPK